MKKKEEVVKNPLLEAIAQINMANPELNKKNKINIVDIITFCDSPEYYKKL